jgi:hypothetical protein
MLVKHEGLWGSHLSSIPQVDEKLSLVMVRLNHMRIHTFWLWMLVIPSYSETQFVLEQNLCCICNIFGDCCKIHLQNAHLEDASCATNSCTDCRWYGYNCRYWNVWCTKAWEVPVFAVRHLVLMIGCQWPWGSALLPIHYVQIANVEHLITFHAMFWSRWVNGQQKQWYGDLVLFDCGIFLCIFWQHFQPTILAQDTSLLIQ